MSGLGVYELTSIGMLPDGYRSVLDGSLGSLIVLPMHYRQYHRWIDERRPALARVWPAMGVRGIWQPTVIALEGWWLGRPGRDITRIMQDLVSRDATVIWDYT